ncbi:MAG: ABC transporter permease subunit, partial [Chloroflexota bacterium]|nr:ABC transporter permease subunit [Chloroflexota bacterium]
MCILIALTAGLSLLYGVQYYVGSPLRLAVTSEVYDLALSPDGSLVAAGTQDGTVRVWDLANDWALRTLAGHTGPVTSVAFAYSGSNLFSAGHDGTVRLWNLASGQIEKVLDAGDGPLNGLALTTDGSNLATIGEGGIVRVWEVETGQVIQSIGPAEDTKLAVALGPDGTLVAAGDGQNIQLWDARTGEPFQRLEGHWEDEEAQENWLGHERKVTALAFSPDGVYVASGSAEGIILIWDVEVGKVAWETKGHLAGVSEVVFDASGGYLLSGGEDNMVRRWRVPTGKFAGVFKGHLGSVTSVAFGPDANTVFSGGTDGGVRFWDGVTQRERHLAWTKFGFMPVWGTVLAVWMVGSGLLGLLLAWGLWRVRTWGHLGALSLYLIGPIFTIVLPLLETTAYPLTWSLRFQIAWPLIGLLVWYIFLVGYLRWDAVAIIYQAPGAKSLAQQLMAARRAQETRHGLSVLATWLFTFVLLFSMLRRFGLDIAFMRKWLPFIMEGAGLTMLVSAAAIALATVLALLGALARLSKNPVANGISGFYISLIRGTPLLVQIYIWYLALPQVGITLDARVAGILALGV